MDVPGLITDVARFNANRTALSYPPIPTDAELFQASNGFTHETPETVHGWQWSSDFGRWSALVTFSNGWNGFTYPKR